MKKFKVNIWSLSKTTSEIDRCILILILDNFDSKFIISNKPHKQIVCF